ncbi:MAG: hypothetical protein JWO81_1160 [Alphaproteobacteria bacterium]|nr:hypothetical protein [Alphaproteobacteria bacterium]
MVRLKALPVSITRFVDARVVIDRDQIKEIFLLFTEMYQASLESSTEDDREYLEKRGKPTITVRLTDGSTYEGDTDDLLDQIETDHKRLVRSIEISAPLGDLSGSVRIGSTSINGAVTLHVAGPDDKARRIAESIERITRGRRDVTTFVADLWPTVLGLIVALLAFARSMAHFLIIEGSKKPLSTVAGEAAALTAVLGVFAIIASIPFEVIKQRWLKDVAFLWGADLATYSVSNRICQVIVFGIPTWFIANLATALLF